MGTVLDDIRDHVSASNRATVDSRLAEFFPKYDRFPSAWSSFREQPAPFCRQCGIFADSAVMLLVYFDPCITDLLTLSFPFFRSLLVIARIRKFFSSNCSRFWLTISDDVRDWGLNSVLEVDLQIFLKRIRYLRHVPLSHLDLALLDFQLHQQGCWHSRYRNPFHWVIFNPN